MAANEMEPLEAGRRIENLLNFGETRGLNFPGRNFRNNGKGMSYLNDGKVSPFSGGREGDVMRRTVCEPTRDDGRWGEGFTGVPPLSISGIRNKVPASAQPLGFSADVKPSMEKSMPEIPTSGKSRLPVVAGAGTGAASVPAEDCRVRAVPAEACPWPADAPGYVNREPGLEEAWNPAELPAAVAGAPGLAGKAAAAALDPVLSYGMDRRLLDFFMREKQ